LRGWRGPLHRASWLGVTDAPDLAAVQACGHRHLADVSGPRQTLFLACASGGGHVGALEQRFGLFERQVAADTQARQRQQQFFYGLLQELFADFAGHGLALQSL